MCKTFYQSKRHCSIIQKKITFSPEVKQRLGVNQHLRVKTRRWYTPFIVYFSLFFCFFFFSICDEKKLEKVMQLKMISLSQRCAKHPFAGQNIQQSLSHTTTEAAPTPCQTAEHLRMCNLTKSFLNMILFSEHCAKHPFARQNKQQTSSTQQPKQLYHRARQQNIRRCATSQNHFLT